MERLYALFLLAWSLVRSLAAPLLGTRRGLKEFRESYKNDRLPELTPEERADVTTFGRCIACGLCEGVMPDTSPGAGRRTISPMDLALAHGRSMPDFDAATRDIEHLTDAVLQQAEAVCPTRVPLRKLAHFVRTKAAQLE